MDLFQVQAIPRVDNTKVDALSNLVIFDTLNIERLIKLEILKEKSVTQKIVTVNTINQQARVNGSVS